MKILGAFRPLSGGDYHRVVLPLSQIGADFVEVNSLYENIVKNYDVLWLHGAYNKPYVISQWRSKYGFKVVLEVDDNWVIPRDYHNYEALVAGAKRIKELCLIADTVIVSNERIKNAISYWTDSVVVHNRIPYNYGQYHVIPENKETFMNRKVRVGFCGSTSHVQDYFSIIPNLTRLKSDPRIEWVLSGVDKSTEKWSSLTKKMNWTFVPPQKPVNYISLYGELDIILCPLRDNELNRSRSGLKVYEAACTNTLPILSNLYKEKDIQPELYMYEDWTFNIQSLISNKQKLWELKHSVSQTVRDSTDYHTECVLPRQAILEHKRKDVDLNIYGIVFADRTTEYTPYENKIKTLEEKSYFFEHNVVKKLIK